jgi:presequence protease
MIGGGVEDELRQPVFSLGLKGVKEEDVDKVEPLIINALKQLKVEGFSKSATEAAINTIEFSLRENNTGRFPRGLSLMLRSMSAWIYDRDPFQPLKWQDDLEKFKARMDRGEDVFAPLIEKYLLANPHRVTVELKPNAALGAEVEKEEVQELQSAKSAMPTAQLEAVAAAAEELKLRQETPDPPEALSCIPSLSLSDIPREVSTIPTTTTTTAQGSTLLNNDLFTNDILYLEVALDMSPHPLHPPSPPPSLL